MTLGARKIPFEVKYNDEESYLTIRLYGSVTAEQIIEAAISSWTNEGRATRPGAIWDFRDADLSLLKSNEVFDIAKSVDEDMLKNLAPFSNEGRSAIVSASKVVEGLWHMFQVYSPERDRDVRVFADYTEAVAWVEAYTHEGDG